MREQNALRQAGGTAGEEQRGGVHQVGAVFGRDEADEELVREQDDRGRRAELVALRDEFRQVLQEEHLRALGLLQPAQEKPARDDRLQPGAFVHGLHHGVARRVVQDGRGPVGEHHAQEHRRGHRLVRQHHAHEPPVVAAFGQDLPQFPTDDDGLREHGEVGDFLRRIGVLERTLEGMLERAPQITVMDRLLAPDRLHFGLGAELLDPLPDAESVPAGRDRLAHDDRAGDRQQTRRDEPEPAVVDRKQAPPVKSQPDRDHRDLRRRHQAQQAGAERVRDTIRGDRALGEHAHGPALVKDGVGLRDQAVHLLAIHPARHLERLAPAEEEMQTGEPVERLVHHERDPARLQAQDEDEVEERNMVRHQQDRPGVGVTVDAVDADAVERMGQDQAQRAKQERRPPDQQRRQPDRQDQHHRVHAARAATPDQDAHALGGRQQDGRAQEHRFAGTESEAFLHRRRDHPRPDPHERPEARPGHRERETPPRRAVRPGPRQREDREQDPRHHQPDQHAVVLRADHGDEPGSDRNPEEPHAPGRQGLRRDGVTEVETGSDEERAGDSGDDGGDQGFRGSFHGAVFEVVSGVLTDEFPIIYPGGALFASPSGKPGALFLWKSRR